MGHTFYYVNTYLINKRDHHMLISSTTAHKMAPSHATVSTNIKLRLIAEQQTTW